MVHTFGSVSWTARKKPFSSKRPSHNLSISVWFHVKWALFVYLACIPQFLAWIEIASRLYCSLVTSTSSWKLFGKWVSNSQTPSVTEEHLFDDWVLQFIHCAQHSVEEWILSGVSADAFWILRIFQGKLLCRPFSFDYLYVCHYLDVHMLFCEADQCWRKKANSRKKSEAKKKKKGKVGI